MIDMYMYYVIMYMYITIIIHKYIMYVHTKIHTYRCIYNCTLNILYTYTHTYTHKHTHKYTHTILCMYYTMQHLSQLITTTNNYVLAHTERIFITWH